MALFFYQKQQRIRSKMKRTAERTARGFRMNVSTGSSFPWRCSWAFCRNLNGPMNKNDLGIREESLRRRILLLDGAQIGFAVEFGIEHQSISNQKENSPISHVIHHFSEQSLNLTPPYCLCG